jgi:transposase
MYDKGVSKKQIARELKMSKNTVKRLLALAEEPVYRRERSPTKVDDYKDIIRLWYLDGEYDFIGTRIFNELVKIGYTGSINPVYRYLQTLDNEKGYLSKKATVRFETPPGDQAQFDWAEYMMDIGGERIKIYCFTMVLSYSRKKAAICSKAVTGLCIYEAIQDLFKALGGITRELVIDNPKALVTSHKKDEEVEYNTSALKLFMHLKTDPNACEPFRARTKGKVEKPNQYIEEQFVKGSHFEDMNELNDSLGKFMETWNRKVHGTTRRTPEEMFEEEKTTLLPVPPKLVLDIGIQQRKVSPDSHVTVGTNRYSVPVAYVDRQVKVRTVYGYRLEIYDSEMNLIRTWGISEGRHERSYNNNDYRAIASRVPSSIPEIQRVFEATFPHGPEFYELARRVTNQPYYHAKEVLKLLELYDVAELDIILAHCIENNIFKIDDMRKVIKERFFELIMTCERTKFLLSKEKERKERFKLKNEEALVRNLTYY